MESKERTRRSVTSILAVFVTGLLSLPWTTCDAFFPNHQLSQRRSLAVTSSRGATLSQQQGPLLQFSDIPRDEKEKSKMDESSWPLVGDIKSWMPPPPEDQFIMTGDVAVLFLYAFTSHYLNNFVVDSVISNADSIQDALTTLDPMGEVISLHQQPVWVDLDQYDVSQNVLTVAAKENLLNHWGPLFSTAGSACVALCTCWLVAGWWHRAFLFQNSLECDTGSALVKTMETWLSMALLMMLLTMGFNEIVSFLPPDLMHQVFGTTADQQHIDYIMTKADSMLLIDSMTVLIAWRFMANSLMKFFM